MAQPSELHVQTSPQPQPSTPHVQQQQQWSPSYGQPQQPYFHTLPAAAPHQPVGEAGPQSQQNWSYVLPSSPPKLLPAEKKSWAIIKSGFWAVNIVVSIITLGLTAATRNSGGWGALSISLFPIATVALIWSSAELITRAFRKCRRGIHPGAHVALHLLLTLSSLGVSSVYCHVVIVYPMRRYRYCGQTDTSCYDPYEGLGTVFIGLAISYVFLTFVNLVLLVGACVDTSKRNRALRNMPVMMVQNPAGTYTNEWQALADAHSQQPQGQSRPQTYTGPQAYGGYPSPTQPMAQYK